MEVHTAYFGQFISIMGHCIFGLWPLVLDTLQKVLGFCVNIILIKCKCIVLGALRTYLSTDMFIYVLRPGVEF